MENEMELLGKALFSIQQFEVSFIELIHLELESEDEINRLHKLTLGNLISKYADKYILRTSEIEKLLINRNILCHRYFWTFHTDSPILKVKTDDIDKLKDAIQFLNETIDLAERYKNAIVGVIANNVYNTNKQSKFARVHSRERDIYYEIIALYVDEDRL